MEEETSRLFGRNQRSNHPRGGKAIALSLLQLWNANIKENKPLDVIWDKVRWKKRNLIHSLIRVFGSNVFHAS